MGEYSDYKVNYFGETFKICSKYSVLGSICHHICILFRNDYKISILVFQCNIFHWIWYGIYWVLGRVLAVGHEERLDYYTMQSFCLTVSPAFIMGGVYFTFGQLVVVHGSEFSILPPLWYSYFLSLLMFVLF